MLLIALKITTKLAPTKYIDLRIQMFQYSKL